MRSRGDWGVVDAPSGGDHRWQASILAYERLDLPGIRSATATQPGPEVVYSRPLVVGPNTLEFELPEGIAPTHAGPLLSTWYELRVHTADGRRLGARHRVEVLS